MSSNRAAAPFQSPQRPLGGRRRSSLLQIAGGAQRVTQTQQQLDCAAAASAPAVMPPSGVQVRAF